MKVLISFINHKSEPQDPNRLVGVFDLDKKKLVCWLNLGQSDYINDVVHATGMCYTDDVLYIGLIPARYRLTSKLYAINFKTGKHILNDLRLTKGIHGICSYTKSEYDILLANSCQNDLVTAITMSKENLICEDVYFDYLERSYPGIRSDKMCDWNNWPDMDDNFHNNSIAIAPISNSVWTSSFFSFEKKPWKITKSGKKEDVYNKPSGTIACIGNKEIRNFFITENSLRMPHTIYFDCLGYMLFCESWEFKVHHSLYGTANLEGYTRGICEDNQKGGYWIGLSNYRKGRRNGEEITFGNLKGAKVVFIDYLMKKVDEWDLSEYGLEIFDILPFKAGNYQ